MSTYQPIEPVTWNPFVTYKAFDTTGHQVVVKRFAVVYEGPIDDIDVRSRVDAMLPELRSLTGFRGGEGIASWIRFEDRGSELYFVRALYDAPLIDRLPPEPGSAPIARLLTVFRSLARGFDQLRDNFPVLSFFVQPDDLYLNGDSVMVANWGLDALRNLLGKGWHSGWVGVHGSMDVASCYPQAEGSHLLPRVLITPSTSITPVFALAALYVYFRTGHGPFMSASIPNGLSKSARMEFWNTHSTVKQYLEGGEVSLDYLPHETERQILTQALIPESRFTSCVALINELESQCGTA